MPERRRLTRRKAAEARLASRASSAPVGNVRRWAAGFPLTTAGMTHSARGRYGLELANLAEAKAIDGDEAERDDEHQHGAHGHGLPVVERAGLAEIAEDGVG